MHVRTYVYVYVYAFVSAYVYVFIYTLPSFSLLSPFCFLMILFKTRQQALDFCHCASVSSVNQGCHAKSAERSLTNTTTPANSNTAGPTAFAPMVHVATRMPAERKGRANDDVPEGLSRLLGWEARVHEGQGKQQEVEEGSQMDR